MLPSRLIRTPMVSVRPNIVSRYIPTRSTYGLITSIRQYSESPKTATSSASDSKTKGNKSSKGWGKWIVTIPLLFTGYVLGASTTKHTPPTRELEQIETELKESPEFAYLYNHPEAKELRELTKNDPDWKERRYYDDIPLVHQKIMLTSGLLRGKGYLTVEPLLFQNKKKGELIALYHIGDKVDGHDGIVHGGFLATLMDEALTRCGFPLLPNKYGVTATLDMNYRAPTKSNSYVVLRAKVDKVNGRRVIVKGAIETLPEYNAETGDKKSSHVLVDGEVLLVEPKWAKYFTWFI